MTQLMSDEERQRKIDFLCGYRNAWLRERAIESDIAMLRMQRMNISGISMYGAPRGSQQGDLSGYAAAVDELLREWEDEAKKKLTVRREIWTAITRMDNIAHQNVLAFRYLALVQTPEEKANRQQGTRLRRYEDIAKRMSYSVQRVKQLHSEALAALNV